MPIYEYICEACGAEFEELVKSMTGASDVCCTQCDSPKVTRKLSVPSAPHTAPDFTPPPSCGGCGQGPGGACPFQNN